MHLHHSDLDLGGESHLNMLKTVEAFPAYPKTMWCEDSVAVQAVKDQWLSILHKGAVVQCCNAVTQNK